MPERVRWGILGAGGICNDFACGVVTAGGNITAIGASSLSKAKALAEKVPRRCDGHGGDAQNCGVK